MSRRRRRTVIVGEGASVEIGRWPSAREHKWRSEKLAEELVGAMGGRWLLPTVTRGSPERKSRRREHLELGACTVKGKEVQIMSLCPPGRVKQKKREEEVSVGSDRGSDDVAAGERLGEAMARVWQDNEEGKEVRGMERTTRGRKGSRRWTAAACTVAVGGRAAPAAEQEEQRSRG
jgi:hypothetical protein